MRVAPSAPVNVAAAPAAAPLAAGVVVADPPERPVPMGKLGPVAPAAKPMTQAAPAPLSEPPPPQIDPAARLRHRDRYNPFEKDRLGPHELALAVILVLAGVGGLALLWYSNRGESKSGPGSDASEGTSVVDPPAVPTEKDLAPKPLPARLLGVWELRSDDGRSGRLVLGPNGHLAASSTAGESPLPDYEGNWYLFEEKGDRFVLEFAREHRGFDGYKVTVLLTTPDAFTLVETLKGGVPTHEKHRFVRTGPAPLDKAVAP
jgi:hypothetical protein